MWYKTVDLNKKSKQVKYSCECVDGLSPTLGRSRHSSTDHRGGLEMSVGFPEIWKTSTFPYLLPPPFLSHLIICLHLPSFLFWHIIRSFMTFSCITLVWYRYTLLHKMTKNALGKTIDRLIYQTHVRTFILTFYMFMIIILYYFLNKLACLASFILFMNCLLLNCRDLVIQSINLGLRLEINHLKSTSVKLRQLFGSSAAYNRSKRGLSSYPFYRYDKSTTHYGPEKR